MVRYKDTYGYAKEEGLEVKLEEFSGITQGSAYVVGLSGRHN